MLSFFIKTGKMMPLKTGLKFALKRLVYEYLNVLAVSYPMHFGKVVLREVRGVLVSINNS